MDKLTASVDKEDVLKSKDNVLDDDDGRNGEFRKLHKSIESMFHFHSNLKCKNIYCLFCLYLDEEEELGNKTLEDLQELETFYNAARAQIIRTHKTRLEAEKLNTGNQSKASN